MRNINLSKTSGTIETSNKLERERESSSKKQVVLRYSIYELLRFVFAFLIVIHHFFPASLIIPPYDNNNIGTFVSFGHIGVLGFIIITAFFMHNSTKHRAKTYVFNILPYFLLLFVFTNIFYFYGVYSNIFNLFINNGGEDNMGGLYLWYLFNLFWLYFFMPYINIFIHKYKKLSFAISIFCILLFASGFIGIGWKKFFDAGSLLYLFSIYFFAAWFFHYIEPNKKNTRNIAIFFSICILLFVYSLFVAYKVINNSFFLNYLTFSVFFRWLYTALTIILFIYLIQFIKFKSKICNIIGRTSIGIYCFQASIKIFYFDVLKILTVTKDINYSWYNVLIVFSTCFVLSLLLLYPFEKFSKWLNNKYNKPVVVPPTPPANDTTNNVSSKNKSK